LPRFEHFFFSDVNQTARQDYRPATAGGFTGLTRELVV
jgi:hypothetical protein